MKNLILIFISMILILVGCSKDIKIDRVEHLDIYKIAFKNIFEQDASFYNNSRMTYLYLRTDNLDELTINEKKDLLGYIKQISGVEVSEGTYSDIETNLSKGIFGGMSIALEGIQFISNGTVELTSRKTFLGSIQMRQNFEKKNNLWTVKKDKILKSK